MKIIRNRLKKCCTPTQAGNPGFWRASADTMVPGYRAMKASTDRELLPKATHTVGRGCRTIQGTTS
jgi:hypothetical protein